MVDAVDVAVETFEYVSALAVGVVEDDVEHRHPQQARIVGVDENDLLTKWIERPQDRPIVVRDGVGRAQVHEVDASRREVAGVGIGGVDPALDHSGAERTVAHHRRRDRVPAECLGDQVRRHLAPGQCAVGKVPQRHFATNRFVDTPNAAAGGRCCVADEGRVARRRDSADDDQFSLAERII